MDDLLSALPIRGLRADVGTKHSRKGGATALVDLESATEFEAVNAVTEELWILWKDHDPSDLVPMCFDNIVLGIEEELREHLGPELPALRVVVHEVLPHIIEANESNNQRVGRMVVQEALRRLDTRPQASDLQS
jgi:hypothetical protein